MISRDVRLVSFLLALVTFVPHTGFGANSEAASGTRRGIALLGAPSNLGLRPPAEEMEPGVRGLPEAIRATDLAQRLNAQDFGRVAAPAYSPDADPITGYRNGLALARYSRELATRLAPVLDSGKFTLLLGGDCSVLLGTGLALRKRGRFGLAYIDAHDDYSPPINPSVYTGRMAAAGKDLALATGAGPRQLVDLDGAKPYFRREDIVHIGLSRTSEERELFRTEVFDQSGIAVFDIDAVRHHGAAEVVHDVIERLNSADTAGYWIHLDVDVLDASIMSAVDSPNPRGMTFDQLQIILSQLLASPKAVGLELTIFDPTLDPEGHLAGQLAGVLERAFESSGRLPRPERTAASDTQRVQDDATFATALLSRTPDAQVAGAADIFAPLLGHWDLDVVFYDPDGRVTKRTSGEWHFARTLEGRAIQDVWIVPPRSERKPSDSSPGEYGATMRFYDPRINAWHSVWHGVVNGIVWPFIGRLVAGEIVLERIGEHGDLMHWVFYDLRPNSFKWRSEVSLDGGRSWRVEQVMHARRQTR